MKKTTNPNTTPKTSPKTFDLKSLKIGTKLKMVQSICLPLRQELLTVTDKSKLLVYTQIGDGPDISRFRIAGIYEETEKGFKAFDLFRGQKRFVAEYEVQT